MSQYEIDERARGVRIRGLLAKYRPHYAPRILDLGCGDGIKAAEYHQNSMFVTGVEANQDKAKSAGGHLTFVFCAEVTPDLIWSLRFSHFDWVTGIDFIEHLPTDAARHVIRAVQDYLSPCAFTLFTPEGDTSSWRPGRQGLDEHRSLWRPADFLALGFEVDVLTNHHGAGRNALIAHWKRPE